MDPIKRDYRKIYRLLVRLTDVDPDDEDTFVEHFTGSFPGNEWRLGRIGSKYYRGDDSTCGRVDCYPEDFTKEKGILLMYINGYLDQMAALGPEAATAIIEAAQPPK